MKLPRFSLRDLFWLMLVAAMGCAWWVDRRREAAARRQAESRIADLERLSNSQILFALKKAGFHVFTNGKGEVIVEQSPPEVRKLRAQIMTLEDHLARAKAKLPEN